MSYDHKNIEKKWQDKWAESGIHKDYSKDKKFYALDMFPYPSGAGLHVGHPKGYIATDVVSRFKMLNGYSVLHPMGWDAFGLPAENYAIQNKVHPKIAVLKNIEIFKKQLEKFGFTYDWDKEINTTDPEYYKWTQWIFLKMFDKGLAYESDEPVNWCPSCKTVLANEDLEGGACERCGTQVEKKKLKQWVLKMRDYADRLLYDLEQEDLDWEESIIEQQKNWIGRSEGINFKEKVKDLDVEFEVYDSIPQTFMAQTFTVIAPEHPYVERLVAGTEHEKPVMEFVEKIKKKKLEKKFDIENDMEGIFTGRYVENPFGTGDLPIWVASFVLVDYGTGVVNCSSHDERDFAFAKKYNIPLKNALLPQDKILAEKVKNFEVFYREPDGLIQTPADFKGMTWVESRGAIIEYIVKKGLGRKAVNYKMRDWVFSRQRYWGEPIPIVHCEKCGTVGVPESELPVRLPEVESYEPTGTGESPLANISEWVNTTCPKCGGPAKRETNTMPQWAGSSWYYLAYIMRENSKYLEPSSKLFADWIPVSLYVGGAEHATRHLLYARFWHKFLYDIGIVYSKEPFKKLVHVGLINAEDGRKMSKRWNNVINPDEIIEQFGADSIRLYEMFMGPFTQNIAWSTKGVVGVRRFLEKVNKQLSIINYQLSINKKTESILHKTIKKVTEDIENFRFNTAISQMMIMVNEWEKEEGVSVDHFSKFLILLSPFAPHIAEELWASLGNKESIFKQKWPKYDPELVKDETIKLVLQVNGKLRDTIEAPAGIAEEEAKKLAMENEKVKKWTENKEILKIIFVKEKLVNIVVK